VAAAALCGEWAACTAPGVGLLTPPLPSPPTPAPTRAINKSACAIGSAVDAVKNNI